MLSHCILQRGFTQMLKQTSQRASSAVYSRFNQQHHPFSVYPLFVPVYE